MDAEGKVTGIVCSFIDVSGRASEEGASEHESKFKSIFESAIEAVTIHEVVRDEDGVIVDWILSENNPAAQRYFGQSLENVAGRRMSEQWGAEYMEKFVCDL